MHAHRFTINADLPVISRPLSPRAGQIPAERKKPRQQDIERLHKSIGQWKEAERRFDGKMLEAIQHVRRQEENKLAQLEAPLVQDREELLMQSASTSSNVAGKHEDLSREPCTRDVTAAVPTVTTPSAVEPDLAISKDDVRMPCDKEVEAQTPPTCRIAQVLRK